MTAATSGFSVFVVASADKDESGMPVPPAAPSSSDPEATILVNPALDAESVQVPENENIKLLQPILEVIEKIRGHLSLFSILVVLMAGLFVWDYLRRTV